MKAEKKGSKESPGGGCGDRLQVKQTGGGEETKAQRQQSQAQQQQQQQLLVDGWMDGWILDGWIAGRTMKRMSIHLGHQLQPVDCNRTQLLSETERGTGLHMSEVS